MSDEAEQGRVDAEEKRVTAETERVEAEGSGSQGEESRREAETGREDAETGRVKAEKKRQDSWWRRNQGAIIGYLCGGVLALALGCGYLGLTLRQALDKIDREGVERRDENCRGWEGTHKQEITDLKRSFSFYEDPSPVIRPFLYNPISLGVLAERIRDARYDQDQFGEFVPAYCDDPGVGRPELKDKQGRLHDPEVPETPPKIKRLLEQVRKQVQGE